MRQGGAFFFFAGVPPPPPLPCCRPGAQQSSPTLAARRPPWAADPGPPHQVGVAALPKQQCAGRGRGGGRDNRGVCVGAPLTQTGANGREAWSPARPPARGAGPGVALPPWGGRSVSKGHDAGAGRDVAHPWPALSGGRREQQSAGGERGETASQLLSPAPPSRGGRGGAACTTRRPGAVEGRVIDRPGVVRRRSGVARSASGPDGDWGGRKRMGSPPPLLCCVCAGLAPARAAHGRRARAHPFSLRINASHVRTQGGAGVRGGVVQGVSHFFFAVREKKREGG